MITNKIYIGQTIVELKLRWQRHCVPSSKTVISNSIHKHGRDNFIIEQIDSASSIEELNQKEVYWIKHYHSLNKEKGYNVAYGGGNRIMTDEIKLKISITNSGKKKPPFSEEHKAKLKAWASSRKHSKETKLKMSKKSLGRKKSKEHRENISKAKKGKPLSKLNSDGIMKAKGLK